MGWLEIVTIIIQILTLIMGIFNPNPEAPTRTIQMTQYQCQPVRWSNPAHMEGSEFVGTVEQTCDFLGLEGAGLNALSEALAEKVEMAADVVYAGPVFTVSSSGEAVGYDVSVDINTSAERVAARGKTQLTNAFSGVSHKYNLVSMNSSLSSNPITDLKGNVNVVPGSRAGWYRATVSESMRIKKPLLMWASSFQSGVKKEIEKRMPEKVVQSIQEMALHL